MMCSLYNDIAFELQKSERGNLPATGNRQSSKNHARLYR